MALLRLPVKVKRKAGVVHAKYHNRCRNIKPMKL